MSDLFVPVSDIHIGDRIRKSIKSHDITRGHFAEILGVSNSKVDRILQNQTIETFLLYDISKKLGINFFSCYCRDWNPEDNSGETLYYYHIGKAIELYMKSINLSQSVLAEKIGMQQAGISKLLKKNSIDTGKLVAISNYLGHNFFADFYINAVSNELKTMPVLQNKVKEFEKTQNQTDGWTTLLKRNEELAAEVALLKEKVESQRIKIEKFEKDLGIKFDTSFSSPIIKIKQSIPPKLLEKLKIMSEKYNIDFDTFLYLMINKAIENFSDEDLAD